MWRINQQLIFDPNARVLKNGDNVLTLNASASRCLALFLQHPGQIITHDALLEEGWRSLGVHLTDNSLRQMLSMLRKQFLQLRVEGEIFVTVHRRGYRLHENVAVEVWQHPSAVEQSAPETQYATVPGVNTPSAQTEADSPRVPPRRLSRLTIMLMGMLAGALLVFVLALLGMKVVALRDVVAVSYKLHSQEGDRSWYVQREDNPDDQKAVEHNIQLLTRQLAAIAQPDPDERHVYINHTQLTGRFSWFICHNLIEQRDASCRSVTMLIAD